MSAGKSMLRSFAVVCVVAATLMVCGAGGIAAPRQAVTPGTAGRPPVAGPLGRLTDVVIQRLLVGDQVAAAKFGTGRPIDDPVREQEELAQVRRNAVTLGIDPEATARFFQDQITASKVVQRGLFTLWTERGDLAPTVRPDLTKIRTELDALTTELLRLLVRVQNVRREPSCRVWLAEARVTGENHERLDRLHRRALSVALGSVCA
jgi:chorismate mutase